MFGLFYLAWLALAIALFVLIVRNALKWFREPELRKHTLGHLAVQLVALSAVTWPFMLGRAVFELKCKYRSGLQVESIVDLREGGYLIWPKSLVASAQSGSWLPPANYKHQAVQDLLMGRIKFFEVPIRHWNGTNYQLDYEHFALGDLRRDQCVGSKEQETMLLGLRLPAGKCITYARARESLSRFRLEGDFPDYLDWAYRARRNHRREFVNLDTGTPTARYQMYSHWSGLVADAGSKTYVCPTNEETGMQSPLNGLSAFVLRDRHGQVVALEDVRTWKSESSGGSFAEIPPRNVTGQLYGDAGSTCRAESVDGDIALHRVQTYAGRNHVPVRLDSSDGFVGQVEVVVNHPDRPVFLQLDAHDSVVWHVSRTMDTAIVAVLVTGVGGQAVLGVERAVPLFISTGSNGPGTNCSPSEKSSVHQVLVGNRKPSSNQSFRQDLPRFVLIGSEVPDPSKVFYSRDRTLADFTMDLPPPKLPLSVRRDPLLFSPDPLE